MEEEYKFGVNEIREMNQVSLETFTFDMENLFEPSADLAVKKLIKEVVLLEKEYNDLDGMKKKEPERFELLKDQADRMDIDLEMQLNDHLAESYYKGLEIWVLLEMKVIYLYKFLEINVKKLLHTSFHNVSTKKLFKWEALIEFLKSKNVNMKEVEGYMEIYQLKELNNSFKHSDKIGKEIVNLIPEFKDVQQITYNELNGLYERLKGFPIIFLEDLSSKIYNELYSFDEEKVANMSKEITLRMEKESAMLLIKKIKSAYDY